MRKITSLILTFVLVLSLAACGGSPAASAENTTVPESTAATQPAPAESISEPAESVSESASENPGQEDEIPADLAAGALPAVGDVICGFEVKEIREEPIFGASVVYLVHRKTGAGVMYIANDDMNRYFALTFGTQPIDDTGLPHVFEHATLSGSERYPSADLFMNLSYQSYNTLMNAYTMDRMTMFPLGSMSQDQLLALADYYIDSCYHPMIMKDESIYRTEAWRYNLTDADAKLTIEGTVYSEMLGATTLESQAYLNAMQDALPGSILGWSYGGNPDAIPNMTYESLKAYHDLYYHPSNCLALLYGQLDNYTEFLRLLNAEYRNYEAREFSVEDPAYKPLAESTEKRYAFPAEKNSSTQDKSTVIYSFVLPEEAWADGTVLSYLTGFVTAEGTELAGKLRSLFPSASFSSGLEIAGPVPVAVFELDNANPENAEAFRREIDAALEDIAKNGMKKEMLDSYASSFELSELLVRENSSVGENIITSVGYDAHTFGDVWHYFDYEEQAGNLVSWNEDGTYASICAKYFGKDAVTALTVTYPEPGLKEEKDAALEEKLAKVKEALSAEEIDTLVKESKREAQEDPATAEMVKALTVVDTASLPEEVRIYEVKDETNEQGVRYIEAEAGVSGVGRTAVNLDVSCLNEEELLYLKFYKDLVSYLDTEVHSRNEISTLATRYLSDGHIYLMLQQMPDKSVNPYLQFIWTARDEDLEAGYGLMEEMFFKAKLNDTGRVKDGVNALLTAARSEVYDAPYSEVIRRSMTGMSEVYAYSAYLGGVSYYEFLTKVAEQLENDPKALTDSLLSLRNKVASRDGAVIEFAGSAESAAVNRKQADAWMARLAGEAREKAERRIPVYERNEAIVTDSSVYYNGISASYEDLGIDKDDESFETTVKLMAAEVLSQIVTDKYLIPQLRDGKGVYSIIHNASDAGVYLCTYRDPNVKETFEIYESLPEQIGKLALTQEDLDGYILSEYSLLAEPAGELTGAMTAAGYVLSGTDQQEIVEQMKALKTLTPEIIAECLDLYGKLIEKGVRYTAGGMSGINGNAEMYDEILNPFGAQDKSEMAFTDVSEDREDYDAIRFVYEEGTMMPLSEDVFGPEENARVGELAAYLYMLVGGDYNEEEALSFLQGYLIFPKKNKVSDEMTRKEAAQALVKLLKAAQAEVDDAKPTETLEDGDSLPTALAWALGHGYLKPHADENGKLRADANVPITRAELAWMEYIFYTEE